MNKIDILGTKVSPLAKQEVTSLISNFLDQSKKRLICTVNTEFIVRARKDEEFSTILNKKSDLNIADGFGLLWAAKFLSLKTSKNTFLRALTLPIIWLVSFILIPFYPRFYKKPLPDRIAGVDLIYDIAKIAASKRLTLFLLGSGPTVAQRAALQLQTDIVGLKVSGTHDGSPNETKDIIETIKKSKADILFVAFGSGKQEKWLSENLKKTPCRLGMGVGGSFDLISKDTRRAPGIMQKLGLEWLFRLIIEPGRIIRQLQIPYFMYLALQYKIKHPPIS